MSGPEIAWYVARLAEIPCSPLTGVGYLDNGVGSAECRRLGSEVHALAGADGLTAVARACRRFLDPATAAQISRAWTGIGQWSGDPAA